MSKNNPQIKAEVRTILGRKVRQLRRLGLTPATVYGKDFTPISIQINTKELDKLFSHAGESSLVELLLDDKVLPIIFRNPQYHPVEEGILHIDCYKVNLKEKIIATVPVKLIGESQAVKEGNVMIEVSSEIEVEALPSDLPEEVVVDISSLEVVDSAITVADLKLGDKIEIKTHPEQIIVKIEAPKIEVEEPVASETTPVDVPATAQKTEEEKAAKEEEKKD